MEQGEPCAKATRLLAAVEQARSEYASAMFETVKNVTASREDVRKLRRAVVKARSDLAVATVALEMHRIEHECGTRAGNTRT
jgi:hypothetical protein